MGAFKEIVFNIMVPFELPQLKTIFGCFSHVKKDPCENILFKIFTNGGVRGYNRTQRNKDREVY